MPSRRLVCVFSDRTKMQHQQDFVPRQLVSFLTARWRIPAFVLRCSPSCLFFLTSRWRISIRNSLHTCVPVVSADTMAQQHSQAEHGLVCVFSDSTMAHISTAAAEDSCSHRLEKKTLQGHREGDTSEGWATLFHVFLLQLHSTTLHYTRLH